MDNKRRKKIEKLKNSVQVNLDNLESIQKVLEEIHDEELDVNTNLEEYFPTSENYEISSEALSSLESATECMSEAVSQLEDLISNLESAME